jgi:hypothetical protein
MGEVSNKAYEPDFYNGCLEDGMFEKEDEEQA